MTINSQQALEKRMPLSEAGKKVLMGGIVLKKVAMGVILSDNDLYQIRGAVPLERLERELALQANESHGKPAVLEKTGYNFVIYDGTGTFEINGSLGDFDRDVHRKMYQIKKGDIVFVAGELVSMNSPSGYFIRPSDFYSESEMEFYRQVAADTYDRSRKQINEIRKNKTREPAQYSLPHARQPWDVVKLFLKPSHGLTDSDYCWLEFAADSYFNQTGDIRAARLIVKYYLIHISDEKRRYIEEENTDYPLDFEENFFSMYPHLQGVVEWPEDH
ncbi:MAG: hypothetical protein Q8P24_16485 [Desulfobacterales bacterium]|nr:hypothetical protein [Desulfobacterales bacterium]